MSLKLKLARAASWVERRVDSWRWQDKSAPVVVMPYIGYATPENLLVRGRVLSNVKADNVRETQSKWTNFRQMLRLFMTDEVADVTVTAGDYSAVSDEEGYFTILIPRKLQTGLVEVEVTTGDTTTVCPVIVPDSEAKFGVISDIDDTQMQTGAFSLARNIWTSLTGNALTRRVFPDAIELMTLLHEDGRNPVYYVSSSPWNLHAFLERVFDRAGLPKGPKFLRDYGISETQFITGTHGDHKGSAIDQIMAAQPDLNFILIGDTGQHDAHVYYDAVTRHEGRVDRVILRAAGPVDQEDMGWVGRILGKGVPVTVGSDYNEAIAALK
ncbi:App1 family protein [Yoonia sp. 208BN28-4]|uniref:App1 family protein n=1 Tax=Yoonia sp. 208BN28-4 TaxID=3126505 RepID=UPI0030A00F77